MKLFVLLVVLGAAFSNPIPDVTKDEERAYLEDNLLDNPKIKALLDVAIEKKKKDEAAEVAEITKMTEADEPEVALGAAQKDAAEQMAEKLMANPKVHDVVEHMFNEKDAAKKESEINDFKQKLTKVINDQKEEKEAKVEKAAETQELTPELKDHARAIAHKMMDSPKLNKIIKQVFADIKKNPSLRDSKMADLKLSIKTALGNMKKKKDAAAKEVEVENAKELYPEMKDMAHKVATQLMDNPIIHNHVTDILQENDPTIKAKKMKALKDAIHRSIDAAKMKQKDETEKQEDEEKIQTAGKKDKMKDAAKLFAAKMMDNPKIHIAVTKIFKQIHDEPEKREEGEAKLKDSIRKALEEVKKKKDEKKEADIVSESEDTVQLDAEKSEMAKRVATNLMKNTEIHDAVVKIAKEIRDHPEQKEKKFAVLKDAVHLALAAAMKKRDEAENKKEEVIVQDEIDHDALQKKVAHDIEENPKLKAIFEKKDQSDELANRVADGIMDSPKLKDEIVNKMKKLSAVADEAPKVAEDTVILGAPAADEEILEEDDLEGLIEEDTMDEADAPKLDDSDKDAEIPKVNDEILSEEREIEFDDEEEEPEQTKDEEPKLDMDELLADLF